MRKIFFNIFFVPFAVVLTEVLIGETIVSVVLPMPYPTGYIIFSLLHFIPSPKVSALQIKPLPTVSAPYSIPFPIGTIEYSAPFFNTFPTGTAT